MAKVLRRLLNEAKDKMTDEVFFTTKVMRQHFEGIIEGVCKTFKRHIKIQIINEGSSVAFTNGNMITVNLNNDWIKNQPTRLDKYYIIVGIILHECGHILYTDFKLMEKCFDALEHNRLFPIIDYSETLAECFDENMGRRFLKVYQTLDNCVEDGHIEKRVIRHVPGYGECLLKVRKLHLADAGIKTYERLLQEAEKTGSDIDRIGCVIKLVLIYAKFGVDNVGDVSDDLTKLFYRMTSHIDAAVNTNNAASRKKEVNIIFDMLIDFISDEIEGAEVAAYNKAVDAVNDLNNGRVDCVIIDKNPAEVFGAQFSDKVDVLPGTDFDFEPEFYAIALPKGDEDLAVKINTALKKFKDNGTYDSLVKQYIEE